MNDVFSSGKETYEAAGEICGAIKPTFKTILEDGIFTIKVVLIVIWNFIEHWFKIRVKKDISGQVALITGGGNGLGRAISLALAKEGCTIVILDVDIKAANKTCEDVLLLGVKAKAYMVNVTDPKAVDDIRDTIEKDVGHIDILINNAGIMPNISFREGTPSEIEHILRVNILTNFWTVRTFLKNMIQNQRGHIVCISSLAGLDGLGRSVSYSATKYAVRGFMDALSEELRLDDANDFIKTTTIFPSYINTRRDVVDLCLYAIDSKKLELLTPEGVANATVQGILYNKRYVTVPSKYEYLINFKALFPMHIQDILSDNYKPKIINHPWKINKHRNAA